MRFVAKSENGNVLFGWHQVLETDAQQQERAMGPKSFIKAK